MMLLQRGDAFVAMYTAECFEDIAVGLLGDQLVLGELVMLVTGDNVSFVIEHDVPFTDRRTILVFVQRNNAQPFTCDIDLDNRIDNASFFCCTYRTCYFRFFEGMGPAAHDAKNLRRSY